jgi:tetratricopeptide (TPR) repeat protein
MVNALADTLDSHGCLALRTGEHADALKYFTEALALLRDIGDTYGEADTLTHLGDTHAPLGDNDRARREWDAAVRLYEAQHRRNEATRVRARLG